jgi:hypothetical protein
VNAGSPSDRAFDPVLDEEVGLNFGKLLQLRHAVLPPVRFADFRQTDPDEALFCPHTGSGDNPIHPQHFKKTINKSSYRSDTQIRF